MTPLLLAAGIATAGMLAGPLPWTLDRWSARTSSPRAVLLAWCLWALACSVVLVALAATAGALVGGWFGVAWVGVSTAVGATGWLFAAGAAGALGSARARRRHRDAVQLIASFDDRWDADLPAWVLEDERPLAYAIPGARRPVVVLTRGCLALTDERELRAVLSHEHDHARLVPSMLRTSWSAWAQALPLPVVCRRGLPAVEAATEMLADDAARAAVGSQATIAAICRLQTGLPAACDAFGWTPDAATLRRVRRLMALDGVRQAA